MAVLKYSHDVKMHFYIPKLFVFGKEKPDAIVGTYSDSIFSQP